MRALLALSPKDLALAGGVLLAFALALGMGLAALATPPRFKDRIRAVEGQIAAIEAEGQSGRMKQRFADDAVCQRDPAAQSQALRDNLTGTAAQLQLALAGVEVSPLEAEPNRLAPIRIRFQAAGGYGSAMMALDALSRVRPQVFTERVSLTSRGADVVMIFEGRAFCSAS